MNPGELDRRIELISVIESSNTNTNEPLQRDDTPVKIWAKYEPMSEVETYLNDSQELVSTAKFTIRYTRINEKYRIKYNNKLYDIEGIIPDGRKNYLVLTCRSTQITNFKT